MEGEKKEITEIIDGRKMERGRREGKGRNDRYRGEEG